jgi:hypothetical protein
MLRRTLMANREIEILDKINNTYNKVPFNEVAHFLKDYILEGMTITGAILKEDETIMILYEKHEREEK